MREEEGEGGRERGREGERKRGGGREREGGGREREGEGEGEKGRGREWGKGGRESEHVCPCARMRTHRCAWVQHSRRLVLKVLQSPALAAGGVDELVEEDLFACAQPTLPPSPLYSLSCADRNILCAPVTRPLKAIPPDHKGEQAKKGDTRNRLSEQRDGGLSEFFMHCLPGPLACTHARTQGTACTMPSRPIPATKKKSTKKSATCGVMTLNQ